MTSVLSQSFKTKSLLKSFYTGGQIEFSADGRTAYALCDGGLTVFDLQKGVSIARLSTEGDEANVFAVCGKDSFVLSGASQLLRHFRLDEDSSKAIRSWSGHDQPLTSMDADSSGTLLISGSMDKTVKVWSLRGYYCSHNFRGHAAPVSHVKFVPSTSLAVSVSTDFEIRVWCLSNHKCLFVLKDHLAKINSIDISNKILISAGNDQIVNFWDLNNGSLLRQLPVFEAVVSLSLITGNRIATVGEKGLLKIWEGSRLVSSKNGSEGHAVGGKIRHIRGLLNSHYSLYTVGEDLSIAAWSLTQDNLLVDKNWLGSLGEVVSVRRINGEKILCATNDENPRIIDLKDNSAVSLLKGHTDLVLCSAVGVGGLLATGGKDGLVAVWQYDGMKVSLKSVLRGHTGPVNGLCFSKGKLARSVRLFSASEDRTIKCWDLEGLDDSIDSLPTVYSVIAHKKGINDVTVAPNDKVFATAGSDKEVKIWDSGNGKLIGVCAGHRRGVWSVSFSPSERVVASASGDTFIKIWNLSDFSCIRTLQGHELSALSVRFLPKGMQLISSGGDGTIRLWNIRTGEGVWVGVQNDEDDGKIWSVDICESENLEIVTGSSSGKIVIWEDNTVETTTGAAAEKADSLVKDTQIGLMIKSGEFQKAFSLAFQLKRPGMMVQVMEEAGWAALENECNLSIKEFIDEIVSDQEIIEDNLSTLLCFIKRWITTSRLSHLAQEMVKNLFSIVPLSTLQKVEGYKSFLEVFESYGKRHMQRIDLFSQRVFVLDAILQAVKGGAAMSGKLQDIIDEPSNKRVKTLSNLVVS